MAVKQKVCLNKTHCPWWQVRFTPVLHETVYLAQVRLVASEQYRQRSGYFIL